jgi:hypothetical protein
MKAKKRFCFLPQITMTLFIGLWPPAWPAHGEAADLFFTTQRGNELDQVRGPVRQMTVTTKDSIATLRFSSNAILTPKTGCCWL